MGRYSVIYFMVYSAQKSVASNADFEQVPAG